VGKCVADLSIYIASLKADLVVYKVGVKEESLDTESLIARKLRFSKLL
jgi:hypothetical protein